MQVSTTFDLFKFYFIMAIRCQQERSKQKGVAHMPFSATMQHPFQTAPLRLMLIHVYLFNIFINRKKIILAFIQGTKTF